MEANLLYKLNSSNCKYL